MTQLHSEPYKRFAQALRRAREQAGLSQYDLAERLAVDQSFISKYESCRRRLDVVEFLQIAVAIGVDYRAILDPLTDPLTDADEPSTQTPDPS
ncbi:MAG: helix-turn-helix transcriptional regulator [Caulobacter sp.]